MFSVPEYQYHLILENNSYTFFLHPNLALSLLFTPQNK